MTDKTLSAPEMVSVSEMLRQTAQNTYALLNKMANHIERLESENADMKRRLSDDFK